ncbi:toll-like receptor 4 [Ruditapes philippinarum]|uniref:toll-like receptor 4 n=1 Tax=Ruditapes philippinarum TaxID=129788 RepID=UPI00295B6FC0|nr:toll-like receptor 4 [Ruditapes philippinarum]
MKGAFLVLLISALLASVAMINCVERDNDLSNTNDVYCDITENVEEYLADCSYRNLTLTGLHYALPPNKTYKITGLNLIGNSIKRLSNMSWGEYTSLRYLSLANNGIEVLEEGDFNNLSGLELLDLSLNRIRYTCISEQVFTVLTNLQYLDLKQNLTDIWQNETYPIGLSNLRHLKFLMIDGLDNGTLPKMKNLSELYLSGEYGRCNITNLTSGYFSNVQNVQHLFMSNCSIKQIVNGTFRNMSILSSLDLARNIQLGLKSMANITFGLDVHGSIKRLNLNSLYDYCNYDYCEHLEEKDFKYLFNTSIEMLLLEKNHLVRMTEAAVDLFPESLRYMSISDNMLLYGKYVKDLMTKHTTHNLVYVDTSKMYKTHISLPKASSVMYEIIATELHDEDGVAKQYWPEKSQSFTSLYNAMLTRLRISDDFADIWNTMRKNNISNGIGTANTSLQFAKADKQAPWKSKLEYLDLSDNLPGVIEMAVEIFNSTPNITFLNVSNNYLGYPLLEIHKSTALFESAQKLRTLDLSNNGIGASLHSDVFANLSQLQYLYLSNNKLTNISFEISHLKELKYLDLSFNHLEEVCKKARRSLDNIKDVTLNLQYNSMKCTCRNIKFVKWLEENKNKIKNLYDTNCTLENDTSVPLGELDFHQFYFECSPPAYYNIILATSLSILAFVITVTCGLVYRFKWNLRYLYYMTKFKLVGGYQPIDDREYDKDVFVSYANEDRMFVHQHVVKELETNGNISLLVHDRDFRAGEFVADNIMRAITSTRRTLVVLTEAYIGSKWCMYELNMATMEAADTDRNVLCVILKEDIPVKYLPIEIINILKKKTYMEYPTEEEHMALFWNRLRATLSRET